MLIEITRLVHLRAEAALKSRTALNHSLADSKLHHLRFGLQVVRWRSKLVNARHGLSHIKVTAQKLLRHSVLAERGSQPW